MNSNKKLVKKLFPAVLAAAITVSGVTVPVKANTTGSSTTWKQIRVVAADTDITADDITFTKKEFTYSGEAQGPKAADIVVKKGGVTLQNGTDYDLEDLSDKTDAGEYTFKVKGKTATYTGEVSLTWKINPKETTFKLKNGVTIADKVYAADDNVNAVLSAGADVEFDDATVKGLSAAISIDYNLVAKFKDGKVGEGKDVTVSLNPVAGQKLKNYTFKPVMLKGNIVKKVAAAPSAPTGTVTVDENAPFDFLKYTVQEPGDANTVKYEYSKDEAKNWQDSNVFKNISVGEEHDFFIRKKETENTKASEAAKTAAKVKFEKVANAKTPTLTYKVTASGTDKVLTINRPTDIIPGYDVEYSFDTTADSGKGTWSDTNTHTYKSTDNVSALNIGIRYKENKVEKAGTPNKKDTLNLADVIVGEAPVIVGTKVIGTAGNAGKFMYKLTSPKVEGKTYRFDWSSDGDSENNKEQSDLESHPFTPGKKVRIFAYEVNGTKKGAVGYTDVDFALLPREDNKVPAIEVKSENDTANTGKKKITITFGTIPGTEKVEYKLDNGTYAEYTTAPNPVVKDNLGQATITVYARYKAKGVYAASKEITKYIVLDPSKAPKGFNPDIAASNSTAVKPNDPKKDDSKKDNTKKPDETKKPDTKKDDTKTGDNTTKPANVDKAIKDAFKKSTKSGSVSLTGIGSALKKAVGENAASLSVNLKTSKTKATAASVTKKLKGSKLVKNTVYSLNVKSGATNLTDKQVSGSKIKVTLKVSLGNKNRTVYVMDVSTGKRVKAKYNAKTKKITFTTANVGDFVIVNKAK